MNVQDLANEVMAIMTLCSTHDKPRAALAAGLREEHFSDPRTKELYGFIMALAQRRKQLPTYDVLQHSTQLTSSSRELLDAGSYPAVKTAGDAEQILAELEKLRKSRVVLSTFDKVMDKMKEDEVNPEDAFKLMEQGVLEGRAFANEETLTIGPDGNFLESISALLNRKKPNTVPTGFHDFDNAAGGLPRGGLTVLAATSGGGKSCLALQFCVNAFLQGYSAAIVTLEMNKEQTTGRLSANLSGINYTDINLARTNDTQKQRINRATASFYEEGEKEDKCIKIYHMTDTTISEIALQLRVFKFDIIVIDYINLLNKEDSDFQNEAQALGEIARVAKIQATSTNAAWVILAQLNEQGMVKYSRAIKEHSDYMLTWTYGDAEKESHLIEIDQQKSRHSESFKFNLRENFKIQRFENTGNPDRNADMGVRKKKKKKVERHPTAKPMPGLAFEDDDDDDI